MGIRLSGTGAAGLIAGEVTNVLDLTAKQLAYLRRVYRICGPRVGPCAESRAVARAIGATEDERIDIEGALARAGYIEVGSGPGTVALTDTGRRRAAR